MKKKLFLLFLAISMIFCACGGNSDPQPSATPISGETEIVERGETIDISQEATAMAEAPAPALAVVLECSAPGTRADSCDVAVIDYSNSADGYVMVKYTGSTQRRLKVRVAKETTYTYNLPKGVWQAFPLSDGDGTYKVTVYQNVSGNQYVTLMSSSFTATLTDQFAPFIRPNQYVDYSDAPNVMKLGEEICTGKETTLEKVAAVYDYVVDTFTYDYDKAATVKSGYLPVLENVLQVKTGICFDYASLMTAILRSQQIPCKLVVGYAGDIYHAWISVWTEESGWMDGVIYFDGSIWKRMDPTFASSSHRSNEIMDFIENGSYTVKYLY